MKRLLANAIMLASGITLSSQLMALGLGEISLKSTLNQPLKAEIELLDYKGLSDWEIKAALAKQEEFDQAGVERLYFLQQINFKVEKGKILLSTTLPVNEPFLSLIVDLDWPTGRALREYTVLIDPPVFEEQNYQTLITAPSSREEGTVTKAAPQPAKPTVKSEHAQADTYKVQPNDSLWSIARKVRPADDITINQMMIALQEENPQAFIGGNINRLKSHAILRVPDADEVRGVSDKAAIAEVLRQNQSAHASQASPGQIDATGKQGAGAPKRVATTGGEVRLITGNTQDNSTGSVGGEINQQATAGNREALENELALALENADRSKRENEELQNRVDSLQEQIATLQRLISLKDDALANMQVSGGDLEQINTTDEIQDFHPDAATLDAAGDDANLVAYHEHDANAVSEDSVNNEEEFKETPHEEVLSENPFVAEQEESFMDGLLENPIVPVAALGILLIAGLLAVRALKARKEDSYEDFDLSAEENEAEEGIISAATLVQTAENESEENESGDTSVAASVADDEFDFDDIELEDSNSISGLRNGGAESHENNFAGVAQTEDVISETEIYLAYGKYDQAIDLLESAIQSEPDRMDLRLRLLEVLADKDDAAAFSRAEANLAALGNTDALARAQEIRQSLSAPLEPQAFEQESATTLSDDEALEAEIADLNLDSVLEFDTAEQPKQEETQELANVEIELPSFEDNLGEAEQTALPVVEAEENADANNLELDPDFAELDDLDMNVAAAEAEDDELDFLSSTDETSTKLDLARAYIDMDDTDGARELLEEVLQEGNEDQKSQAKELIESLA